MFSSKYIKVGHTCTGDGPEELGENARTEAEAEPEAASHSTHRSLLTAATALDVAFCLLFVHLLVTARDHFFCFLLDSFITRFDTVCQWHLATLRHIGLLVSLMTVSHFSNFVLDSASSAFDTRANALRGVLALVLGLGRRVGRFSGAHDDDDDDKSRR